MQSWNKTPGPARRSSGLWNGSRSANMAVAASKALAGLGFFKQRRAKTARVARDRVAFMPIVLVGCGLVLFALAHVWLRLQVVHLGYELSTTSKLQNQLEQENRELKVEL